MPDARSVEGGSSCALPLATAPHGSPVTALCFGVECLEQEQRQALAAVKEAMPMVVDAGGVVQKLNEEKETGGSVLLGP